MSSQQCQHPSKCEKTFDYEPGVCERFCTEHTCALKWCFNATTLDARYCPDHVCVRCLKHPNHVCFAQERDLDGDKKQAKATRRRLASDIRRARWCNVCMVLIDVDKPTPYPEETVPSCIERPGSIR